MLTAKCNLNLRHGSRFPRLLYHLLALTQGAPAGTALVVLGDATSFEDAILRDIAAHLGDGSYIETSDADGAVFRWVFEGGAYKKVYPTFIWPNAAAN